MDKGDKGTVLLKIAREAIAQGFGMPPSKMPHNDWLDAPGATFVTLTRQGDLRGCIGSLEAHRPLRTDVQQNALAAAFRDSRFPPLGADEFADTNIEVSLLSPQQPMAFTDETNALAQLCPNVDGVVFEYEFHRSTFLPQVWEQLPQPRQFMAHLKLKAGLPEGFWSPKVRLFRYTVEKWKELN